MAITPGMVKALRETTGLPMMECKKALEEALALLVAAGKTPAEIEAEIMQKAEELLRKKGHAQIAKRAGRETAHGRLVFHQDGGRAVLVELLCETEPVTATDDFIKLGQAAAQAAAKLAAPTPDTILAQAVPGNAAQKVGDLLHDAVNRIRENIKIGRVGTAAGHFGHYIHHDGRKGVLVEFSGPCPPEVAADVCMHVAAMRPPFSRRDEVDPALVEQERQIAAEQVKDKPANMIDKIVTGKLNRWYAEIVLLEQPFVKDDKQSVGQFLRGHGPDLTVKRFVRLEIGET
jgi:elongation factor Ts